MTYPWKLCSGFWSKHDPDEVFSYKSFKMVCIRDRYLGLFHHLLQFGILIYIIVYVIFVSRGFLEKQPAIGLVRIGVIDKGTGNSDPATAGLCATSNCIYPPVDQIADGSGPNMFITTRVNETAYFSNCSRTSPACIPSIVSGPNQFYTGNLDDIMISIDHSAQVDFKGIAPKGYMQTIKNLDENKWEKCSGCTVNQFQSLAADQISLQNLLVAAQLNLSEEATEYLQGTPDYYKADYRSFGAVILLSVTYDNIDNYFSRDPPIKYYYRPQLITSVDDYEIDSIYTHYPDSRTVLFKKGIRIMGVIAGQVGSFRFQTLLIQLTTSLALMKLATTAVDLIAINLLPERVRYKKAKYETTEDFSDLRKSRSNTANTGSSASAKDSSVDVIEMNTR